MLLRWTRESDGVIAVIACSSDGRFAPVADFWIKPFVDNFGATRQYAEELQEQFADLLVTANNRLFVNVTEMENTKLRAENAQLRQELDGVLKMIGEVDS